MILTPFLDDGDITLYAGDCIEVMRQLPPESIDAIITDPPYGIGFMGKEWDVMDGDPRSWASFGGPTGKRHTGGTGSSEVGGAMKAGEYDLSSRGMHRFQAFSQAWASEAFRVLKPGAHLLAFAGARTYHRMASGVEDAGFEIRDCLAWLYGSGFPKSLDVSKAIDKAAGAEREIVGTETKARSTSGKSALPTVGGTTVYETWNLTTAATEAAKKWDGWGTALKPAFEPIVLARKPLTGTVAQNVLAHGTGALNINATRIGTEERTAAYTSLAPAHGNKLGAPGTAEARRGTQGEPKTYVGRWPANVALDDTAAALLDEQSGERASSISLGDRGKRPGGFGDVGADKGDPRPAGPTYGDNGGASRFFYTAKASRQDRNTSGANNTHPTVKPTDLMRWLIRLTTPPGGIILDPFGGSGTTGVAARAENTRCILIEREDEYLNIIRQRLAQLSLFSVPDEDAA